jgi:signal transduction histidine kinase
MKKIAFRISSDFTAHFTIELIQKKLKSAQIESVLFKISDSLPPTDFQGLVLIANAQDMTLLNADILHFHEQSKPVIVFDESAKYVAHSLRKHNPVIAVQENDPDIPKLNKMGIDTEVCPQDDFITDRYTKILSTTIKLSDSQFSPSIEKGLHGLCKELVEMC